MKLLRKLLLRSDRFRRAVADYQQRQMRTKRRQNTSTKLSIVK